jgi:5-methyltetrahydropteroyltriglutamate--homocysteine methyltransferase
MSSVSPVPSASAPKPTQPPRTFAPELAGPGATVLGYPRIGPRRELKRALESYWRGRLDAAGLDAVAAGLRTDAWRRLAGLGLESVPVNDFSYYDQVLDTAVLLGAIPARYAAITDPLERYFAMARGDGDLAPLEMTKWFDTNYHYLVPEIAADTAFELDAMKPLGELAAAAAVLGPLGVTARPVVLGPVTFLRLSKAGDGAPAGFEPLDRLDDLLPVYVQLLTVLAQAGAGWVQLDEPALAIDLTDPELDAVRRTYETLGAVASRPSLLVTIAFGSPGPALPVLAATGVEAIGLDFATVTCATAAEVAVVPSLAHKTIVAGVVDGRNVWRTDLDDRLALLGTLLGVAGHVDVATSCSLQHVPYSLAGEDDLPEPVRHWLAFADEKVAEVAVLHRALHGGSSTAAEAATDEVTAVLAAARIARAERFAAPQVRRDGVRARLELLAASDLRRGPAAERARLQQARLQLPPLPTTTIGSFPQTTSIRKARADHKAGRIDDAGYIARMHDEIAEVIALQEKLGLDVLVHGEPERNDMVQYFAEQLDGFTVTANGWVQSYGSRCVRPPILFGDVERPADMTVAWTTFAQSLTERPVKGMLTGPVTILAWSFVRDDEPIGEVARQVGLAIRDEVHALEAAGVAIVQVDEPALRELLPLRKADQAAYLDWAITSFRLATSGVADTTSIHTHLCYSEFGEVVDAIDGLDADVTSVEAARSHMEILGDLAASGYARGIGPGVYDIHSPRIPSTEEISDLLTQALAAVPGDRLWVNPDCGLKTRTNDDVIPALTHLVAAAKAARAQL